MSGSCIVAVTMNHPQNPPVCGLVVVVAAAHSVEVLYYQIHALVRPHCSSHLLATATDCVNCWADSSGGGGGGASRIGAGSGAQLAGWSLWPRRHRTLASRTVSAD